MTTPVPNQDETSRMKRIVNAGVSDSIKDRLPHGSVYNKPPAPPTPPIVVASVPPPVQGDTPTLRFRLFSAFWTVASVISLAVNVVLIALLFILVDMITGLQLTANDQVSGLLGGLYNNFVKMDQATISTNIPVDANIPLDFRVPVDLTAATAPGQTSIILPANTVLRAKVEITEGGVRINAPATVTLLQDTQINAVKILSSFEIPIQRTIPIHLDVPVNIPLNQTQLHEPFTGLRQVVEPYYCLVEPNALINGVQVCSPVNNP